MTDKITLVTSKGNKADVPVNLYTDGNLDLSTLASIIDSAAAYTAKDLDGGVEPADRSVWDALTDAIQNPDGVGHAADEPSDHTADACHAAARRHCSGVGVQSAHMPTMPKITMNEIPTVTMNEVEDEEDGEDDLLKDFSSRIAPCRLHDYVKKAVAWHRSRHYHNRPRDYYAGPTLTFDYVDGYGVRSTKSVVLSLTETDPDKDWFTTYTDGEYRNFRYNRVKGDYVGIKWANVSLQQARLLGL